MKASTVSSGSVFFLWENAIFQKLSPTGTIFKPVTGKYGSLVNKQQVYPRVSVSLAIDAFSDMQTAKLRVKTELSTIKTAAGEFTGECLEWYKNCGCDLAATMRRLEDLRSAREAVLRGVSSLAEEVRDKSTKTAEKPQNERETHTFRVFNEQDRNSVKAYLEMMGIEYEEV